MSKKLCIDIILSLGLACRPAEQLKVNKLRFLSSPLDWMMSYSLETAVHLFKTKFETFFQIKEIVPDNLHYIHVKDAVNNVNSIHHFPLDKDIEDFYNTTFRPVMLRRFDTVNSFITHSKHIAFIFNRDEETQRITNTLHEFGEIYPNKNITFINIRSGAQPKTHDICRLKLSPQLTFEEHYIDDTHKDGDHTTGNTAWWVGNEEMWHEILSNIKLSWRSKVLHCFYKIQRKYSEIQVLDRDLK